jgi:hypothetical protein
MDPKTLIPLLYCVGHYDHLYLNYSYCNVYGTGYQLRYVYHNNDSGIVVEYITGTFEFVINSGLSQGRRSTHPVSAR